MPEPKPCPFCGCEMHLEKGFYPTGYVKWQLYGWHGPYCLFSVSVHIASGSDKSDLIAAWNGRANENDD